MSNAEANEKRVIDELRCVLAEARSEFDTADWNDKVWNEFVEFILSGMSDGHFQNYC